MASAGTPRRPWARGLHSAVALVLVGIGALRPARGDEFLDLGGALVNGSGSSYDNESTNVLFPKAAPLKAASSKGAAPTTAKPIGMVGRGNDTAGTKMQKEVLQRIEDGQSVDAIFDAAYSSSGAVGAREASGAAVASTAKPGNSTAESTTVTDLTSLGLAANCPVMERTTTRFDLCHCKYLCGDLNSWTAASSGYPADHDKQAIDALRKQLPEGAIDTKNPTFRRSISYAANYAKPSPDPDGKKTLIDNDEGSWITRTCQATCEDTHEHKGHALAKRWGFADANDQQTHMMVNPTGYHPPDITIPVYPAKIGGVGIRELPATTFVVAKSIPMINTRQLTGWNGYVSTFKVWSHSLKLLQCVTTTENWKSCCEIPNEEYVMVNDKPTEKKYATASQQWAGDTPIEKAYPPFAAAQYWARTFAGATASPPNCGVAGQCWHKENPAVACSVKKTTAVFKVCLQSLAKGKGAADQELEENEEKNCWFPLRGDAPPKPLNPEHGPADWTLHDNGSDGGADGTSNIFKCYYSGGPGDGKCNRNPYAYPETWANIDGLAV